MKLSIAVVLMMLLLALWVEPVVSDETEDDPPPPTDGQIKKMKVKELKTFMANRGLKCDDCFEKTDYVNFVKKNRAVPILPSKRPRKVSKEPIDVQWKRVVSDICTEEGVDEKTCKPLLKVVAGSFEMHGRRVAKQLHKEPRELAKTSLDEPYILAGSKIVKQTLKWMQKTSTTSQDPIRKKIDNEIKMFLTAVGADNVNPMYEKINEKDEL